jgi:hypothetical protein
MFQLSDVSNPLSYDCMRMPNREIFFCATPAARYGLNAKTIPFPDVPPNLVVP